MNGPSNLKATSQQLWISSLLVSLQKPLKKATGPPSNTRRSPTCVCRAQGRGRPALHSPGAAPPGIARGAQWRGRCGGGGCTGLRRIGRNSILFFDMVFITAQESNAREQIFLGSCFRASSRSDFGPILGRFSSWGDVPGERVLGGVPFWYCFGRWR